MTETSHPLRRRSIALSPLANRGSVLAVGAEALRGMLEPVLPGIGEIAAANPPISLRHRSNVFTVGSTRMYIAAMEPVGFTLEQPALVFLLGLEDLLYRWMGELLTGSFNAGRVNRHPK